MRNFKINVYTDRRNYLEVKNLPIAFILVSIKPGMDSVVLESFSALHTAHIDEMYQVFGLYDMIIKTNEGELKKIDQFVASIRQMEGITNTVTMIVRASAP